MTVTKIVEDLLKYELITCEAALVLLKAEAEASAFKEMRKRSGKTKEKNKVEKNISTSNLYSIEDYHSWYTSFTNQI